MGLVLLSTSAANAWQFGEPIDEGTLTCDAEPGECLVQDSKSDDRFREATIRVDVPTGSAFTTTLAHSSGVAVEVLWRPESWEGGGDCQAQTVCDNHDQLSCRAQGDAQCGSRAGAVWCGSHSSATEFTATIRACTYLDVPWPDSPTEKPPEPGALHEANPEVTSLVEQIRQAHVAIEDIEYQGKLELTRSGRRRNRIEVTSVSGRSRLVSETEGSTDRSRIETIVVGDTVYMRLRDDTPFLRLQIPPKNAGQGTRGGIPLFQAAMDHQTYAPEVTLERLEMGKVWYLGTGPCQGSSEVSCHRFTFETKGRPHSMTARVDTLMLDAMNGANEDGPQRAVYSYDGVEVQEPAPGDYLEIGDDPAENERVMHLIMGEAGSS